jgi:hypothetical protein
VFGEIPRYEGIAEDIFIVNPAKNSLVDSFMAYRPVISPNQRWIAYVKFAPYYVEASTEIMLYDLSKPAAQNRPPSDPVHPNNEKTDAGTIIFPPGHENFDGSNILDDNNPQIVHSAGKLHWAPDSRAIVFTDMVADNPAILLVTLDDHGTPAAFRHALTETEACGRDTPAKAGPKNLKLDRAEFQPSGTIALDLGPSGDARCAPHVLQLRREEFQAAATELHVKPTYPPAGRLPNGEVRVPKKKKER